MEHQAFQDMGDQCECGAFKVRFAYKTQSSISFHIEDPEWTVVGFVEVHHPVEGPPHQKKARFAMSIPRDRMSDDEIRDFMSQLLNVLQIDESDGFEGLVTWLDSGQIFRSGPDFGEL
ncbi:MAG: hypothetical protein GC159_08665 [Phycisphaera sp.]|nr:hypothetical protein [Phycisphaera sp.]